MYAFTRDETPGGQGGNRYQRVERGKSPFLAASEFAALDIAGLRAHRTVLTYRRIWQDAIDAGASTRHAARRRQRRP